MDPLTHTMFGSMISGLGFRKKGALQVLVVSSVLPDLDIVAWLFGSASMLRYHRALTHSLLFAMIIPLAVAAIASRRFVRKGYWYYYSISVVAMLAHVFLDFTTQYGVRLLWPIDGNFYSLDHMFIMDHYLIGGLVLFMVLSWRMKKWTRPLARGVLCALVLYYGVRVYVHDRAETFLRHSLERQAIKSVSPLPGGIMRWWFVAGTEEGGMKTGVVDLFLRRVYIHESYPPLVYSPAMEASKDMPGVRAFLEFSRHPYASVRIVGDEVIVRWEDLGFSYLPGEHFIAEAIIGPDGKAITERVEM